MITLFLSPSKIIYKQNGVAFFFSISGSPFIFDRTKLKLGYILNTGAQHHILDRSFHRWWNTVGQVFFAEQRKESRGSTGKQIFCGYKSVDPIFNVGLSIVNIGEETLQTRQK